MNRAACLLMLLRDTRRLRNAKATGEFAAIYRFYSSSRGSTVLCSDSKDAYAFPCLSLK